MALRLVYSLSGLFLIAYVLIGGPLVQRRKRLRGRFFDAG